MEQKRKRSVPLGVRMLGGLNFFILGILFLVSALSSYFDMTLANFKKFTALLKESGINITMSYSEFKNYFVVSAAISAAFCLSGWGLLRLREWARKLTVYFSFSLVLIILFAVLAQPIAIQLLTLHSLYLGALILYFTRADIKELFNPSQESPNQATDRKET